MTTMAIDNKDKKVLNVPHLRFPEFSGEWDSERLENLTVSIGDGLHSTPVYCEQGDYCFINGNNIIDGKVSINEKTLRVTKEEAYKYNAALLKVDTILMSINGTIGNVALYNGENIMLGKSACYINPSSRIVREYLFHILSSPRIQAYFQGEVTGTTIKNLSLRTIRGSKILLPSNEEQKKIARLFSLVDERIATQNKIIEDLKKLKSAISKKLLCNDKWTTYKIQDIAEIGRGRVISSVEIEKQRHPLYPVYSSQTSNDGIMGYLDNYMFDGEYITWTTDGANAGTVFYRNGKFNCTNVCGTLKIHLQFDCHFVSLVLQQATQKYVSSNLANPKLMNNTMASIKIRMPDMETQKRLSKVFQTLDSRLLVHQCTYEMYLREKQYLLNQMFI
jgi:putative type I restriction enzyme specificity protein